jgi:hypothetical protein
MIYPEFRAYSVVFALRSVAWSSAVGAWFAVARMWLGAPKYLVWAPVIAARLWGKSRERDSTRTRRRFGSGTSRASRASRRTASVGSSGCQSREGGG